MAFGLARNHPSVDENKRTAAVVCEAFIELNGGRLQADDLELYPQYLGLADGSISEVEFAVWLRERIVVDRPLRVQENPVRYG